MRARLVHEGEFQEGERKKQLSTGRVFTITGTDNVSGNKGDLFIRDEQTGEQEFCSSKDWADPRKYSSVILEFKRGQGSTKDALGLGMPRNEVVANYINTKGPDNLTAGIPINADDSLWISWQDDDYDLDVVCKLVRGEWKCAPTMENRMLFSFYDGYLEGNLQYIMDVMPRYAPGYGWARKEDI